MQFDEDYLVTNYFSLFSIINNLISNALDAAKIESGKIEVSFSTQGEFINITIVDNGTGISPKDMSYIFEPGFTTKLAADGSFSTGLGLAHVKNLVGDMGGEIRLESKKQKGTKFELTIPKKGNFI